MIQRALPEGVLGAGGRVEGYLYFEKISDDIPRVRFSMDLLNPDRGAIGTVDIPLVTS